MSTRRRLMMMGGYPLWIMEAMSLGIPYKNLMSAYAEDPQIKNSFDGEGRWWVFDGDSYFDTGLSLSEDNVYKTQIKNAHDIDMSSGFCGYSDNSALHATWFDNNQAYIWFFYSYDYGYRLSRSLLGYTDSIVMSKDEFTIISNGKKYIGISAINTGNTYSGGTMIVGTTPRYYNLLGKRCKLDMSFFSMQGHYFAPFLKDGITPCAIDLNDNNPQTKYHLNIGRGNLTLSN